jgi:DNA-binding beta-propeller fold protein YncE
LRVTQTSSSTFHPDDTTPAGRPPDAAISLKSVGVVEIPDAFGSDFDHGAFDPKTRRIFIAHTARNRVEVLDHDAQRHIATLPGFAGVAGVVADEGKVFVTNRGAATAALLDADTLETVAIFDTGPRPNGAAIVSRKQLAVAACIGDEKEGPTLHRFGSDDKQPRSIALPGRPRWCATDAAAERLFLAIREPSMVLVAGLPDLNVIARWKLPSGGAHGLDIDHARGRIYVACDDGALVEIDNSTGEICNVWPIAGPPDVTFFNPSSGLVHVAIGEPGVVETIDPRSGQGALTVTAKGAHTTVLVPPDRLYVISPEHGGLLVLASS